MNLEKNMPLEEAAENSGTRLKDDLRPLRNRALFYFLSFFFMECVLKIYVYGSLFDFGLVLMALFTASFSALLAAVVGLFKGRVQRIAGFLALLLPAFWIMLQTVYYTIFSAFFTLYSFSGATDVAEFWKAAVTGILDAWMPLLAMLIPFLLFIVWNRIQWVEIRAAKNTIIAMLLAAVVLQCGALALVWMSDDDVMSEKYLFTKTFIPKLSVQNFGALTTLFLDAKNMIFGMEDAETAAAYEAEEAARLRAESGDYDPHVLDIDFEALAAAETDGTYKEMHEYFAAVTPSFQNEYTGKFAGKNLIWICAEGFSTWALHEELTPTLYKMANECFVFENFYNPIWGVSTSDGEYTTTTGMIPKTGVWSMSTSSSNDMAFCMGNQLSNLGYLCNAYHNHSYTYYDRHLSHPNLGYNYKGKGNGLDIVTQWPESDVEMMEETVGDYVNSTTPFHTYYMTVSGHLEYNFGGNAMSIKHKAEVADLPYSDACKAYIACQIELEDAVNGLLQELEQAGKLDDTLIVLSGDHYPYGLTEEQINELNGSPVEQNFELYHSTLIMWNSAMAEAGETVTVEKPCYAVDILPTISNLMGVAFDSRLLMGRDILSTTSPLVVFSDHSWLTDKGRYNASSGVFTANEGVEVGENYVQNMMDKVNSMFVYSAKILTYDYYGKVVPEITGPLVSAAPAENSETLSDAPEK